MALVESTRRLQQRRVDFSDQLPLFHRVADLHVQRLQLAGDLGADVDVLQRLQGADRRDRVFDTAAFDDRGDESDRRCFRCGHARNRRRDRRATAATSRNSPMRLRFMSPVDASRMMRIAVERRRARRGLYPAVAAAVGGEAAGRRAANTLKLRAIPRAIGSVFRTR